MARGTTQLSRHFPDTGDTAIHERVSDLARDAHSEGSSMSRLASDVRSASAFGSADDARALARARMAKATGLLTKIETELPDLLKGVMQLRLR